MSDHREQLGSLADSINHLLKITRSYWSGLFHCYRVENLPKTNNDLEQVFGCFRHHTRRTTGRKKAPASLLIRGESRLTAAIVTRIKTFTATDLAERGLDCLARATFKVGITATKTSSTTSFSSFS